MLSFQKGFHDLTCRCGFDGGALRVPYLELLTDREKALRLYRHDLEPLQRHKIVERASNKTTRHATLTALRAVDATW